MVCALCGDREIYVWWWWWWWWRRKTMHDIGTELWIVARHRHGAVNEGPKSKLDVFVYCLWLFGAVCVVSVRIVRWTASIDKMSIYHSCDVRQASSCTLSFDVRIGTHTHTHTVDHRAHIAWKIIEFGCHLVVREARAWFIVCRYILFIPFRNLCVNDRLAWRMGMCFELDARDDRVIPTPTNNKCRIASISPLFWFSSFFFCWFGLFNNVRAKHFPAFFALHLPISDNFWIAYKIHWLHPFAKCVIQSFHFVPRLEKGKTFHSSVDLFFFFSVLCLTQTLCVATTNK